VQRLQVGRILGGPRLRPKVTIGPPDDVFEREADQVADQVVGRAAPEDREPRAHLAHERPSLQQQHNGAGQTVRRQPGPTTTSFRAPANVCPPNRTREIVPVVGSAQEWLRVADMRLTAAIGASRTPSVRSTNNSLRRHFRASDSNTIRYVQNKIRLIAQRLRTDSGAPSALTVECHGSSDATCGAAPAYVLNRLLVFCPSFFGSNAMWQVMSMIHEIAHSLPPASGPLHITDRAYRSNRLYGSLAHGEALTNAESYAMFVRELATGPVSGTAVSDTHEDCPADWRGVLNTAIGRAQRWNRDAQIVLRDTRPAFLSRWSALAATHLGGQSASQLATARSAFDQAQTRLRSRVDFECEVEGGGRCNRFLTYWYALGDFHVCPRWRLLSADDDRAQALLAGLYGYFRISDNDSRRRSLARLARALHYMFWAPPSARDISTALAATRTQPRPPAAPPAARYSP
jgi:hypothetical protein